MVPKKKKPCGDRSSSLPRVLEYSCYNYSCCSIKCTMMRNMTAGASAVLQLRTQFLRVMSRPIKTIKKPFESLQSAAEPRQGAFGCSYRYTLYYHVLSTSIFCLIHHIAHVCEHFLHIGKKEGAPWCPNSGSCHF
jgi:hypothetical protein